MPINPDTHYILEAKLLESSYSDCVKEKNHSIRIIKEGFILYIPLVILSLIASFITVRGRTFLCLSIIILLSVGFFLMLENAKNLAITPESNSNIQDILYGDRYTISEANPEELYNYTRELRENIGKLKMFSKLFSIYTTIMTLIFIAMICGSLIMFMLKI